MLNQASRPRADECPGEEESAEQTEDQDCRQSDAPGDEMVMG